jgi:hypothetical protein
MPRIPTPRAICRVAAVVGLSLLMPAIGAAPVPASAQAMAPSAGMPAAPKALPRQDVSASLYTFPASFAPDILTIRIGDTLETVRAKLAARKGDGKINEWPYRITVGPKGVAETRYEGFTYLVATTSNGDACRMFRDETKTCDDLYIYTTSPLSGSRAYGLMRYLQAPERLEVKDLLSLIKAKYGEPTFQEDNFITTIYYVFDKQGEQVQRPKAGFLVQRLLDACRNDAIGDRFGNSPLDWPDKVPAETFFDSTFVDQNDVRKQIPVRPRSCRALMTIRIHPDATVRSRVRAAVFDLHAYDLLEADRQLLVETLTRDDIEVRQPPKP